jgi:hypothetical protein
MRLGDRSFDADVRFHRPLGAVSVLGFALRVPTTRRRHKIVKTGAT